MPHLPAVNQLHVASDLIPPSEDVTEGKLKQAPAAAVLLAGGCSTREHLRPTSYKGAGSRSDQR